MENNGNLADRESKCRSYASAAEHLAVPTNSSTPGGAKATSPKPAKSSTSAWKPASTSSTPPNNLLRRPQRDRARWRYPAPQARRRPPLHQGDVPLRDWPQRLQFLSLPPHPVARRLAQASWHRLRRRLPPARFRRRGLHLSKKMSTLDTFVREGKVRYIACSNFSGWHLMKSLSVSERYGWTPLRWPPGLLLPRRPRLRVELMPLAADQGIGALIWSPLGWGRLTGKIRRETGIPKDSRLNLATRRRHGPAGPRRASLPKSWMPSTLSPAKLARPSHRSPSTGSCAAPTVSTLIIGAPNEQQLRQNLGAVGWSLTPQQIATLDAASDLPLAYPYWHQHQFPYLHPKPM